MFLKRCDSLVALSTAVCEEIKNVVPGADPKHIAHPVYDHFGDLISREEARQNLGWSADAPILLFFGLVRHYKGLHVLLDALPEARKRVPGLQLVVAGEFYESSRQYDDHIRRLGIDSMITLFDEYIPSDRVPQIFGACDVVVQPYLSATQSGIVQMAFHFERAVIVTDVGGLSEAVGARDAGLVVPPSDPQALSDAIYHFFEAGVRDKLERSVCSIKATSSWSGYTRFILT
jgi:glycosyltransferase involved in cell wall biosynthesis